MGREENIAVFQDTEKIAKSNATLKEAIKNSTEKQKLILQGDTLTVPEKPLWSGDENTGETKAKVIVSKKRSYEAASAYKGLKTCVHNFASASNPGGGVVKGSSAQEEALCRCSTLYFSLNTQEMWSGFYNPHRAAANCLHNDDIIYTPDVYVFKTDTSNPTLMPEKDWYKVNVITCAAPNLRLSPSNSMNPGDGIRKVNVKDSELRKIHERRLSRILDVAMAEGNEAVILGAFGCGAFKNNAEAVAMASYDVVKKYQPFFKVIEFAVYCTPRDEANYNTFNRVMKGL